MRRRVAPVDRVGIDERAAVLGVRGMNASDRGDYPAAFERLPLVRDLALMRNIFYSGVWGRYAWLCRKRGVPLVWSVFFSRSSQAWTTRWAMPVSASFM